MREVGRTQSRFQCCGSTVSLRSEGEREVRTNGDGGEQGLLLGGELTTGYKVACSFAGDPAVAYC